MKKMVLALPLLFLLSGPLYGNDFVVEATSMLERWTSFHWGRDCLVWIVHYPEELVEPWVAAEASRSGMNDSEREQYRRSFVADLRIADTEPFLLTVYVFGPKPPNLGPFASAVQLETTEGRKVPPLGYERKLDQPLSGIVQGLVFFPKQPNKEYTVVLRNLGIRDEQHFAFGGTEGAMVAAVPPAQEVVVVELPPAPKKEPSKPRTPQRETPTPAPAPPPPIATPQDLAELKPEPVIVDLPAPEQKKPVLYISKEKTVENFIRHWIEGETSAMYDLLAESTKTALSEDQFARQVEATGLRPSLREGFKVQWMDDSRVRIVTAQRMLLFRTLRSKILTVGREESIWKVAW